MYFVLCRLPHANADVLLSINFCMFIVILFEYRKQDASNVVFLSRLCCRDHQGVQVFLRLPPQQAWHALAPFGNRPADERVNNKSEGERHCSCERERVQQQGTPQVAAG